MITKHCRFAFTIAILVFGLSATAYAGSIGKDSTFGIGLGGGTLTSGVTGKYYLGETTALQAVVGINGWGMSFGADFIKEFGALYTAPAGRLFWGAGAGGGVIMYSLGTQSAAIVGVSGVVQLGWHFNSFPIEVVSDWRPTFLVGDYIGGLYLGGGGGAVRWFF